MRSITTISETPWIRGVALTVYYSAILAGVYAIATLGAFTMQPFIYQGF